MAILKLRLWLIAQFSVILSQVAISQVYQTTENRPTLTTPTELGGLLAGAAKVDITNVDAGPVDGPMHVRALVLQNKATTAVIITVDAVAIGEIGHIGNDYLPNCWIPSIASRSSSTSRTFIRWNAYHASTRIYVYYRSIKRK